MSEEQVAAVVQTVVGAFESAKCATCDEEFGRRVGSVEANCSDCVERGRIAIEVEKIETDLDHYAEGMLRRAGLSTRELTARDGRIPAAISNALGPVRASVTAMRAGEFPPSGFGISGPTGCGKSFALASILRAMTYRRLRSRLRIVGRKALGENWLLWVSWPEAVNRLRRTSVRDGGLDEVARECAMMSAVRVLILDDVGVERFRGESYADDWMTTVLDGIIDERYNEMRPTWYTTNLSVPDFAERYGARMTSRLLSENPIVRVQSAPDLRLARS